MKNLKYLSLPLIGVFIISCSTAPNDKGDSNVSSSSSESVYSTTETSSDTSTITYSYDKYVSTLNPMDEPMIHQQYYLNHIGDIYNTWRDYQGHGVTIAVIDVGFKYDHPDFYYEDGTSKVSDLSASFKTSGSSTTYEVGRNKVSSGTGSNAHGTFCAGVAAAGINGKGVIGIAPLAELMLLKTDAHPLSICEAFMYAADKGAKVITISIGSYSNYDGDLEGWKNCGQNLTTVFNDAVSYCRDKKVAVISAAGNGGLDSRHENTEYTYPGATTGVIGAGGLAANKSDVIWDGSSYNSSKSYEFCDVFAPADGMYGCTDHRDDYNKYYEFDGGWNGTSFASPIVAGIAALYFEKNPNNSVEDFERDLYNNAKKFAPLANTGNGRVDVGKLLGTNMTGTVTAKIKNSGDLYAYYWNSVTGVNNSWPGTYIGSDDNRTYTISMDANKYDSVIFNTGGDSPAQSIDLLISSFSYNNVYNMDAGIHFAENIYIGEYL